MLDFEVKKETDEQVLVELGGELAGERWTRLIQGSLEEHYLDDGVRSIRVDIGPLRFIDSNGVVTLITLQRDSRRRGKTFRVEGAGGQVRDKLRITGMLGFLEAEA